jgi:hypothetical protein
LRNRKDVQDLVEIKYSDVIADPVAQLARLDWPIDVQKAAAVIDPPRCRFQLAQLVSGRSWWIK